MLSALRLLALWVVAMPTIAVSQDPNDSGTDLSETESLLAPYRQPAEERWAESIKAFDALNDQQPDNPDAILFIGSSSIRRWESIAEDMAPYQTIRRGYGGAKFTDMAVFAQRLITPHRYRAVVMFVGNGVTGKPDDHTPDQIESLARHIISVSHRHQPGAPFFLIEITPTESRFDAWDKIRAVNARLREIALTTPNTYFIATASHYLTADGRPRSELFVDDRLHLNADGYDRWAKLIRRRLDDVLSGQPLAAAGQNVTDVFVAGEEGYNIYRIPAVIRAANGDVLAFCEAREGGDASEIDLVMKRSSDGGATWSSLQRIADGPQFRDYFGDDPPPITLGNPAPVVDLLDPDNAGRIWLPFTLENRWVFVTHSDDHGASWSQPRDITGQVKRPGWGWYATGPVHSIQVMTGPHRGRLVVPADHRIGEPGTDRGDLGAQVILSDDHGVTWRLGAVDDTYDDGLGANETTVVELADGRLYFNTRDQHGEAPGTRGETWSSDAGESFNPQAAGWKAFRPAAEILDPPVVQCSLLRITAGGRDVVVFSGPDQNGPSGEGRSDLRLRYSTDSAESWNDGPLIHVGPAAYSDLVQLDASTLGILFENGDPPGGPYQRIRFARLATDQIIAP